MKHKSLSETELTRLNFNIIYGNHEVLAEELPEIDEMIRAKATHLEGVQILEQFGTWAVTDRGVEYLLHEYVIETKRLHESDWASHLSKKLWVNLYDFLRALYAAKNKYHTD